jgi:serine/threonine protein phosphatase 1
MLRRLFRSNQEQLTVDRAIAPGRRVYAIGDIHGRYDLLQIMHEKIAADAAGSTAATRVIVYLGDYVDRGLRSRDVIDYLLDDPMPDFECIHLLGNHEFAMREFLDDSEYGWNWFGFGGDTTLLSYGVTMTPQRVTAQGLEEARLQFQGLIPASHVEFLDSLRLYHVEGDYLFVHAGVRPGTPLEAQDPHDLIWIRDEFLDSTIDHGRLVVHGHSIVRRPEIRNNRICVDTGAYATGQLTALVIEEDSVTLLST